MRDWMIVDDDHDGRIDLAYQTWLDENRNNKQDKDEKPVGDFKLMKAMGVNTIRLYHHSSSDPDVQAINPGNVLYSHAPNKELLRKMYDETGLMIMMGDLLGAYTIGSGAPWLAGTDYRDPAQRAKMMLSVRDMVMEFKDQPYVDPGRWAMKIIWRITLIRMRLAIQSSMRVLLIQWPSILNSWIPIIRCVWLMGR